MGGNFNRNIMGDNVMTTFSAMNERCLVHVILLSMILKGNEIYM